MLGVVAHIVGQKPGSARHNYPFPRAQIDEYENLIYLCPTHHELIDKQEETFPVEKLLEMKGNHERWVAKRLSRTRRFERMRKPDALVSEKVTSTVLPGQADPCLHLCGPLRPNGGGGEKAARLS